MRPPSWLLWYPRESPPPTEPGLSAIGLLILGMAFPFGEAQFPHLPKWGTYNAFSVGPVR